MPRKRPCVCRQCERTEAEAGRMSLNGLCADCGIERQIDNARQIANKSGPYYENYLAGLAETVSYKILELVEERENGNS